MPVFMIIHVQHRRAGGFGRRPVVVVNRRPPLFRPAPLIATAALTGAVVGAAASTNRTETIIIQVNLCRV